MRGLLSFLLLILAVDLCAQQYRFHQYRVEQGLPSDVIKAVTEDSLGFVWIATDDGLVKYDGVKFTRYKDALRSQFVKGFFHTSDGRLLVFSDLDLVEIRNYVDTVAFVKVLGGERFQTDSTLSYPKSIYEDRRKQLWMGEPKSVIRYDGKKLKRYQFSEENRSTVFVRSFSFFEDGEGNLFTISYNGNVFRHHALQDKFFQQNGIRLPEEISHVLFLHGELWLAARSGLYKSKVINGSIKPAVNIFPAAGVSHLEPMSDSTLVVSTYGQDLYSITTRGRFHWENFFFNFNGINSVYASKDGDIWVSTDKGIVLVQKNYFTIADPSSQAQFVEGIADDEKGNVYYATKETVIALKQTHPDEWERSVVINEKSNYFQSLQVNDQGLWAATTWNVLLIRDGVIDKKFDLSPFGNFVHDLFADAKGNIWLSQAGTDRVRRISPEFSMESFRVEGLGQSEINHIKESSEGMYAVANGTSNYIFFKSHSDSVFRNVSAPVPFDVQGDFNVLNFDIVDESIWLASSEGLLRYDKLKLTRAHKGHDFERYPVSCVRKLDKDHLLFSNSFGLFRYNVNTDEYWIYDEDSGLPSNTITDHGIHVGKDGTIYIGTSYGLACSVVDLASSRKTRTPYCVEARVNGVSRAYGQGLKAAFGAFVTLQFSAITFPENKVEYEWAMDDSTTWSSLDNGLLSLSDTREGEHVIFVRAKKNTGLGWSNPASFRLTIDPPYWRRAEFIFLIFLLVILISWASYAISSTLVNQRKIYLEQQISERTQELKKANEELTLRNTELDRFVYSASHDLSAPLKSILGLIRVAKLDNPGEIHQQYLEMMERSVFKLENFINEVVTYSRNTRMPLKYEKIDFTDFVRTLLHDHEFSPNFKSIEFQVEDTTAEPFVSDATRVRIILNNLISNAIKFHWLEGERRPFVRIALSRVEGDYCIQVTDNGRGIGEEHLQRIFEMFYRATDDAQGSGLGLYILKESVTKLGGTVEAFSKVQEGTTFRIYLPVP